MLPYVTEAQVKKALKEGASSGSEPTGLKLYKHTIHLVDVYNSEVDLIIVNTSKTPYVENGALADFSETILHDSSILSSRIFFYADFNNYTLPCLLNCFIDAETGDISGINILICNTYSDEVVSIILQYNFNDSGITDEVTVL